MTISDKGRKENISSIVLEGFLLENFGPAHDGRFDSKMLTWMVLCKDTFSISIILLYILNGGDISLFGFQIDTFHRLVYAPVNLIPIDSRCYMEFVQ